MATPLPVEAVIAFVREFSGIGPRRTVGPRTRLEADLGLTGDDGEGLLDAASHYFDADLASPEHGIAATLSLGPNETLFGSEGLDPLGIARLVRLFQNRPEPVVRDLTVAELHAALVNAPRLT